MSSDLDVPGQAVSKMISVFFPPPIGGAYSFTAQHSTACICGFVPDSQPDRALDSLLTEQNSSTTRLLHHFLQMGQTIPSMFVMTGWSQ
ncbi:hypothetical protein SKAU_G00344020 [Synaphobranchus kaupii]|uniref:Uncharacterized protein n=1 Tax=Synaphobranchus kaupii TaxID=118154 RepID=A0A9Q1EJ34_SYNKA|nr:hypothetical protein SKAU_G00344020 [Synaphobranchus kaupii]